MKKCGITILGSTGSIGQNTLNVIGQHPDKFEVMALSAYSSVDLLFEQCCYFKPAFAAMAEPNAALRLKTRIETQGLDTQVLSGEEGLCFIAELESVTKVVAAIVGSAGLLSTLSAVEAGKQVLIANKEALVMAGDLLVSRAKESGAILLPVDSEHNALFQCMPDAYITGRRPDGVRRLILTASGGPFLHANDQTLSEVTPEMACQHPNWKMGKKITVDCATLMNKGLEVIEACKLFQLSSEEVEVIVHPQSIIHSLVEYVDGSFLAQLGTPDMRIPITHCLAWPSRLPSGAKRLSLTEIGQLTFLTPDTEKFRCLPLAYEALSLGNAATAVLNASNEVAVQSFLNKEMRFSRIPTIIEEVLQKFFDLSASTLQEILVADKLAREQALKLVQAGCYSV
ncbi:MAG: 1-deoxy-D-xylulose-5-phosphate reductoisomerase [Gammaproteobacteria bacterium 39-13]|nr:1-deoxy-D-xylulose-5-phosphate reductoisomerase [Gammaproteobacteria bacterium]OJV85271.1 MAG: 1-deoxy-D-xylulose-5-phosphate reductoisomerase [Gammaproteobacteria bacterium 39-13]